jgi:PPM family protein phosphatase
MIEIGSALDPGRKRIANKNQDSLCIIRPGLFTRRPPLLVIADGMGGYEGGALASQLVVSSFASVYQRTSEVVSPLQTLQSGVSAALSALKQQAAHNPALAKMGSTVVAVVIKGASLYLINVGDSRAYLVNEREIRQISYDHSLVGEQLRQGIIGEADVRSHPRRNVLSMSISAQRENVLTYTNVFEWRHGDRLVLCSDGLWGPVTEPQIQAVVMEYHPQQAAERLVLLANTNQGPDNISVIVARYQ